MHQPERSLDPPSHWTDNLIGHYVVHNGNEIACESEDDIDSIVKLIVELDDDDIPSFAVYNRRGKRVAEINRCGFEPEPDDYDWDAVRKERIWEE